MLDICLLGTGGMLPLPDRYLTAFLARLNGKKLLIDCGEGTQVTMRLLGWGYKTVDIICFTHYHGDHITGLPGLLLTIGNAGRKEPLTLIGPPGLKKVVEGLTVVCKDLAFELNLIELPYEEQELQIGEFYISILPVPHNVKCFAYTIENRRNPKFVVEKARANNVPQKYWKTLQQGKPVTEGNVTYTPDMVLGQARKGIKVSYCTDCRPIQELEDFIRGADLFICEGMYIEDTYLDQVKKHKHMLSSEAAKLAKAGNVKELWLTHFSPALPHNYMSIDHIKPIFNNIHIGQDRMTTTLEFSEEE
ncbi:ribonuclease Z [Sporanaerobium hydrogeniformans]|uniref:Ribonuclease Z n=1 Tax=Sporanaerobium hydrogeniformans TaxID=3072179 RepID=A0AC61DEF6_9FIRM|nr:ribonuclease Z [Sporanaerobium hydrogeniformans]PHV71188.1 ribonuclease Z [Sporanaerobium hydrogeniformans]